MTACAPGLFTLISRRISQFLTVSMIVEYEGGRVIQATATLNARIDSSNQTRLATLLAERFSAL